MIRSSSVSRFWMCATVLAGALVSGAGAQSVSATSNAAAPGSSQPEAAQAQPVSSSSAALPAFDSDAGISSSALPAAPDAADPQYGRGPHDRPPAYPTTHNDSFDRLAIEAGGGFTAPVNNSETDMTYGWNLTFGGGYKFNRHFALMGEYQFVSTGIPDAVLQAVGEPGGHVHVWSLTADPVLSYQLTPTFGGYVTGGGGYYRKITSFTRPAVVGGYYCDYFYCYPYYYYTDVVVSQYSSNQGGMNIGTGFTWGRWGSAKIYAEARYTWLATPGRSTEIVPVTFGVRF